MRGTKENTKKAVLHLVWFKLHLSRYAHVRDMDLDDHDSLRIDFLCPHGAARFI